MVSSIKQFGRHLFVVDLRRSDDAGGCGAAEVLVEDVGVADMIGFAESEFGGSGPRGAGPATETGTLLRRNRLFLTSTLPFWVFTKYL